MEPASNEGPVRSYIPARVEIRCGDCRFFTSHRKSWCVHPKVLATRTGVDHGYIISMDGDNTTPGWCPLQRNPRPAS
jgi:hypothetical protein